MILHIDKLKLVFVPDTLVFSHRDLSSTEIHENKFHKWYAKAKRCSLDIRDTQYAKFQEWRIKCFEKLGKHLSYR